MRFKHIRWEAPALYRAKLSVGLSSTLGIGLQVFTGIASHFHVKQWIDAPNFGLSYRVSVKKFRPKLMSELACETVDENAR